MRAEYLAAIVAALPSQAWGHARELGVSGGVSMTSILPSPSSSASATLGFALGLEYSVRDDVVLVVRGGFALATATSRVGEYVVEQRAGALFGRQNLGQVTAGARVESGTRFLPVTLFGEVGGGVLVVDSVARSLRAANGLDFGLAVPNQLQAQPVITLLTGVSYRLSNALRLMAGPQLIVVFDPRARVGVGLVVDVCFLSFI